LASSVVASIAIVGPSIKPSSPSTRTNHRNTALCVSTGNSRRVREIVEWSGVCSVTLKPRNSRSDKESATRHAIPLSESIPSKKPISSSRKYTPGAMLGRPNTGL
jgi:hypothetical protein